MINKKIYKLSHDMNVIKVGSDELIVIKDGLIVESNKTSEVYENLKNKYTKTLFESPI